ncbi:AAA family ATPase [Hydrocarboniphaga effusa]|uniref:ExeA family protein n=1 Tax=Hydrocarboniphaga effusa TaxID=243629 RepID=UPI00398BDB53
MYLSFFNLREMPFTITPDPAYLYLSPRHQEALGHLLYGTGQYGGFVQLTGEVGTGKTTIVRTLLEQKLDGVDVAMIHNPSQNEIEFVQSICDELGVDYAKAGATPTLKQLGDALNVHLLAAHAAGKRTVVIIDEAQNLPRDVLEQVRLLTNLETHKEKLLRIMLIGQPELVDLLSRPDLRQLASRITARYHLMPLSEAETAEYIRHRLRVAGTTEELFPPAAIHEIHKATRGVPRLVNILCDRALLGAYSQGVRRVNPETVRRAAGESIGAVAGTGPSVERRRLKKPDWLQLPQSRLRWIETGLACVAVVISIALVYQTFFANRAAQPETSETSARHRKAAAAPEQAVAGGEQQQPATASGNSAPKSAASANEAAASDPQAQAAAGGVASAPAGADLTTLLQSSQTLPVVMSRLIRLWDRDTVLPSGANVCRELSQHKLECFKGNGEWADLRTLNRPALLSLTTGRGEQQHVLLRGLTATFASIETGRGTINVPLDQIDTLWTGEYLLLWRREISDNYLAQGSRGASVVWLRTRLAELDGKTPPNPVSDRFDTELAQQLKKFQSTHELQADGVLGVRTLIALGDHATDTPMLASPAASAP